MKLNISTPSSLPAKNGATDFALRCETCKNLIGSTYYRAQWSL
jgi:hypothetical protein